MKNLLNLKNIAIALLIVVVVFQQCGGSKKGTGEIVKVDGKKYELIKHEIDTFEIVKTKVVTKKGEDIYHETIKDDLARFEQARKDADTVPTIVNEDGSIEKWSIDGDIEKVKRDLDSDIVGLNELIITFQAAVDEDWEIIKEKYNEIFND